MRWRLLRLLVPLVALSGCSLLFIVFARRHSSDSSWNEATTGEARGTGKELTVAVVWPPDGNRSFPDGIQLAFEEITADKEYQLSAHRLGLQLDLSEYTSPASKEHKLNTHIRLKRYIDGNDSSGETGTALARRIATDPNIIAVLGHRISASAIPASLTYEDHGILFVSPGATIPVLTEHDFHFTFRLTPSDREIAAKLAFFAASKGWKRIGMYFAGSQGGESFSKEFITAASEHSLTLNFVHSYPTYETDWNNQRATRKIDFRPMVGLDSENLVDAVMIVDQMPRGAKLVRDLRTMGFSGPILATDKFDSAELWERAGVASNNVYVGSAVDPTAGTQKYKDFSVRFRRRYGSDPGYYASQGYEALYLLANAIRDAQSTEPIAFATSMRNSKWNLLFGLCSFTPTGDIVGRHISVKQLTNGVFSTQPD